MKTVAVTLELQDAFNRVEYAESVVELEACMVNLWLVRWIGSPLIKRQVALRFGGCSSETTNTIF